ncbi:3-keto-disaccharide hydrolase [Haliscomenobacter sp.]|uniref:3-keto-disaccharide hydrolase n=1 Tax=Haliscomenobacter sp. TaxID=2717303 RepID=UPI003BACDD4F
MKISHTLFFLLLILGFGQLNAQKSKMKKIFNGKNLEGWVVPAPESCWTVSKGVLLVKSEPTKKGAILWTEKSYQNFVLQAEFLMGEGTVDSGFFLRSENDQIQIGISGSLKRDMTGSPYIPKLRYPVEATGVKELLKPKDWNSLQIKVIGNTYTAYLNGKQVMTYTSEGMATSGPIGIQLHPGNEMSISYRKILLAEL